MDTLQSTGTTVLSGNNQQQFAAAELRKLAAQQGQYVGTNTVGAESHRLMRIKSVQDRTGLSRSKIYGLISEGKFPPPLKPLGLRIALWHEAAVNSWITQLVESNQKDNGVVAA